MNHLETYESACETLGIDPNLLPIVSHLPEQNAKAILAFHKLSIISEAAWKIEGKEIDWGNRYRDQYKYYPCFSPLNSESGFLYYGFDFGVSLSYVGHRLVFPSKETAEFVGETHLELYRDLMVK